MRRGGEQRGVGATAAVLWLMITLVFLPIALAHGLALLFEGPAQEIAAQGTAAQP